MKKMIKALSMILVAVMLFGMLALGASAAEKTIRVYWDNADTQFKMVQVVTYNKQNETFIHNMLPYDNGWLYADIPYDITSYTFRLYCDRPLNMQSHVMNLENYIVDPYLGRSTVEYVCELGGAIQTIKDGNLTYIDLEAGTYHTVRKSEYVRKKYTAINAKEIPAFSNEIPADLPQSKLTELTVGENTYTDLSKSYRGEGWCFADGYLYLGQEADFCSTVSARGDLTVLVMGCENDIERLDVAGSLSLHVVAGALTLNNAEHTEQGIVGESAALCVYPWGKLAIHMGVSINVTDWTLDVQYGGTASFYTYAGGGNENMRAETVNIVNNGVVGWNWGDGGSHTTLQCDNATVTNNGVFECRWGGGGSCKGIYAKQSIQWHGNVCLEYRGNGGDNHMLYADGKISKYDETSMAKHFLHAFGEWTLCKDRGGNECAYAKRCTICGALLDYIFLVQPPVPVLVEAEHTMIVLKDCGEYEYSIDGETWKETPVFKGLVPGETYLVYQRVATQDLDLSLVSEPLQVDTSTNCKFNQEIPAQEYLCREADCISLAQYYYSCECGKAGTQVFTAGELGEHTYSQSNLDKCMRCGAERSVADVAPLPEDTVAEVTQAAIETTLPIPELELSGCFSTVAPGGMLLAVTLTAWAVCCGRRRKKEK